MSERSAIRDFVFRGLLFESESERFRRSGIKVGADLTESEEVLVNEALSPFGLQRRNHALQMARLYAVIHAFENEVRSLIRDTLDEKVGSNWWSSDSVPKKIRTKAEGRQKDSENESWLEGEKGTVLEFCDFGDLSAIIVQCWEHFKQLFPTQAWLTQRMDELEKSRNFIAHNRMLAPNEFQRIYMYISDWNKVVGL
jgi:hypothetical protein